MKGDIDMYFGNFKISILFKNFPVINCDELMDNSYSKIKKYVVVLKGGHIQ